VETVKINSAVKPVSSGEAKVSAIYENDQK
jgi:hypothetical protein